VNIDIYCTGISSGQGVSARAGCGFVLEVSDGHGKIRRREFHYGLGASPQDLCELQAIRLALAAVAPAFRSCKTVLHIASQNAAGEILKSPDGSRAADEARRWFKYYSDIQVMVHCARIPRAYELAKLGMETQLEFDSLTSEILDASSNQTKR
jgi:hypothetical protein